MNSVDNSIYNYALNSLRCNEEIINLIIEIKSNILVKIESLKDSRDYLLSQVEKEEDIRGSYITQILNGQNSRFITKPYFKSEIGLIPSTTETQEKKKASGTYDFYKLKRQLSKICTNKELDLLKDGIGRNVMDIERNRLAGSSHKGAVRELLNMHKVSFAELSNKCDRFMMDKIDWFGISCQSLKCRITPENCRKIWEQTFNPEFPIPRWTEKERNHLMELVDKHGSQGKWVQIASEMPIKVQPFRCFKKWLEMTSKMETSEEWNTEEDSLLCEVVNLTKNLDEQSRLTNWNKVSLMVPNRSARDCERRWNSLQVIFHNRPFTDAEDYQLLLLIKRMGVENWANIVKEMDRRTVEHCQTRYCELVEEHHPWLYSEDRRLWIYLRPIYRELWHDNEQVEEMTKDLALFKTIIGNFNGRCPVVIRHRYLKLCKWFRIWNRFYQCLNSKSSQALPENQTTSLLSDVCPEKMKILAKIRNIILKTSFFEALKTALKRNGSINPDADASELISVCKTGNSNLLKKLIEETSDQDLMEFLYFIIDLQNGKFVPREFDKYIYRSRNSLKFPERANMDLRCLSSNVRAFSVKTAVEKSLRNRLNELSKEPKISQQDKDCIQKLLGCDGRFSSAMNFAVSNLERTHEFRFVMSADLLEKTLPQFLKLMIQYVYEQETMESMKNTEANRPKHQFADKRQQIAELLILRESLKSIYKTFPSNEMNKCIVSRNLPFDLRQNLFREEKIEQNARNISSILRTHQRFPAMENTIFINNSDTDVISQLRDIKLFPPNKTTLNLFRSFLLQKQNLLDRGLDEFCKIIRLKYDNPEKYPRISQKVMPTPMLKSNCNPLTDFSDSRYLLLRSRILSVLAIPSVMSRLSPFSCALIGDKLHEEQNNLKFSNEISKNFNIVKEIPDNLYRAAGSILFFGDKAPLKCNNLAKLTKRYEELEDESSIFDLTRDDESSDEMPLDPPSVPSNQPGTRQSSRNWIQIFLPDCRRTVFISKDIFQPFIREHFRVDSINGVKVEDILK